MNSTFRAGFTYQWKTSMKTGREKVPFFFTCSIYKFSVRAHTECSFFTGHTTFPFCTNWKTGENLITMFGFGGRGQHSKVSRKLSFNWEILLSDSAYLPGDSDIFLLSIDKVQETFVVLTILILFSFLRNLIDHWLHLFTLCYQIFFLVKMIHP